MICTVSRKLRLSYSYRPIVKYAEVTPRSYQLDGQDNIKDPIGMTGVRLEVDAHVITALSPHVENLHKACEMTETAAHTTVLAGLAAARAVVSDQQTENGVVLIDRSARRPTLPSTKKAICNMSRFYRSVASISPMILRLGSRLISMLPKRSNYNTLPRCRLSARSAKTPSR